MAYRRHTQNAVYDTAAEILALPGQPGDRAYAINDKTTYIHDGTGWILGFALGKIIGTGGLPNVIPGSLAGGTATASVTSTSTNLVGTIVVNTGMSVGLSGTLVSFTLADSAVYPTAAAPFFSPASANASSLLSNYYLTTTSTGFSIVCGTVSLTASSVYKINYFNPGL